MRTFPTAYVLPALFLAATAALVIHPNPFGDQPNAVFDESLFVTSALASLSKPTLPGWDFTPGGAYYGGPLTYLVTLMIAVVAAAVTVAFRSFSLAQSYLLLHTGDLMHVTRYANALLIVAGACALTTAATRLRRVAQGKETAFYLLAGLLFSSSMFTTFLQTGRVWTLQILLDLAAACAVFRFETLTRAGAKPDPKRHATLLLWLTLLAFLQNIAGASTGLWILYAIFLGQFDLKTALGALRRSALPMLAVAATQISFFARFAHLMFEGSDLSEAAKMSFVRPDGTIDWPMQLGWPIRLLKSTHPLILPALGLTAALYAFGRARLADRQDRWTAVMLAHPLATYAFYFAVVFRFGHMVHYVLPLTVACAIGTAFILKPRRWQAALLVVAWIASAAVLAKTAWLYWHPSSERQIVAFFSGERNRADTLISVEGWRLMLPFNNATLAALEGPLASMKRVGVLKSRPDDVDRLSDFEPLVLYGTPEGETYAAHASRAAHVWDIRMECEAACSAEEAAAGTCFGFNADACRTGLTFLQDGENYRNLFSTRRLGYTYFIRKTK